MTAASAGQMPVKAPKPISIEGVGDVSFTNIPFNRGMLAVNRHLHDVYPQGADEPVPAVFYAMTFRLTSFLEVVHDCMDGKHPQSAQFVVPEDDDCLNIHDALVEAAASSPVGQRRGYFPKPLFKLAAELAQRSEAA